MRVKPTILTILALATSATCFGYNLGTEPDPSNYQLTLIKDCQIVGQYPMSGEQVKYYLLLKQHEQDMQQLEQPLQQFEAQSKQLADEVEHLSTLAVQESDTGLHIDKHYMAQQQKAATQLEALVSHYQADFDALADHGDKISATATKFEQAIQASIQGVDFDQIQVSNAGKAVDISYCQLNISRL
jgi:hypothetical protein